MYVSKSYKSTNQVFANIVSWSQSRWSDVWRWYSWLLSPPPLPWPSRPTLRRPWCGPLLCCAWSGHACPMFSHHITFYKGQHWKQITTSKTFTTWPDPPLPASLLRDFFSDPSLRLQFGKSTERDECQSGQLGTKGVLMLPLNQLDGYFGKPCVELSMSVYLQK